MELGKKMFNLNVFDLVKVHIFADPDHKYEIMTRNHGKEFLVYELGGEIGINWNIELNCTSNNGNAFIPLTSFSETTVVFEKVGTLEPYHIRKAQWDAIGSDYKGLSIEDGKTRCAMAGTFLTPEQLNERKMSGTALLFENRHFVIDE